MRHHTRLPRRGGFTLVELLMVITILALLAALTAAGIGRVRNAQTTRTSESTVQKLQNALNQQVTASLDEARDPRKVPSQLVSFCDGDPERARALWVYMRLKNEFPTTFAEALTPVSIGGVTLMPKKTYSSVAVPTTLSNEDQAAVLLYLNLTESGRRGTTASMDDITNGGGQMALPNTSYQVFKDAWGMQISFARWVENAELSNPPYFNQNSFNKYKSSDPFDPLGKLMQTPWPVTGAANRSLALVALNLNSSFSTNFDGQYKAITVRSSGENKQFEAVTDPGTNPTDDIYGYRLARFGARGD